MSYVYILVEPQSKKFYIGSCGDFEKRLTRHFDELHRNVHYRVNSKLDTWKEWQYYKRPESSESTPTEETV